MKLHGGPSIAYPCAHFAGVAGEAAVAGIAGDGLMPGLDAAAAGRAVLAGHDASSCVHDAPRPSVSISKVASVVLPSALTVPSPICRCDAVRIVCMASDPTTSLHTSNLPTRAGNFPKA